MTLLFACSPINNSRYFLTSLMSHERVCLFYTNASVFRLSVNCPVVHMVPRQHPAVDVMFLVVVWATVVVKSIESTQMSVTFKNMGHCMQSNTTELHYGSWISWRLKLLLLYAHLVTIKFLHCIKVESRSRVSSQFFIYIYLLLI